MGRSQLQQNSPNKAGRQGYGHDEDMYGKGRVGQENTPPIKSAYGGGTKEGMVTTPPVNYAAQSREQQYKSAGAASSLQAGAATAKGLSAEDMEKISSAKVKRLTNVTQICKCTK